MPKNSFADDTFDWSQLLSSVGKHPDEVRFMEELSSELRLILNSVTDLKKERLQLKARSQQITRDIEVLTNRGRNVAGRIRSGIKTRYGLSSEQLTEFGMTPRRRRRIKDAIAEQETVDRVVLDSDPPS
ncbi:MAG TPA: hypothetical protein VNM67_04180 [Thermoanaerobaculia bacterium]|jgi:hypothetical protein|nr:hypothetical protein [Thermoanaerobaculia bacterium]